MTRRLHLIDPQAWGRECVQPCLKCATTIIRPAEGDTVNVPRYIANAEDWAEHSENCGRVPAPSKPALPLRRSKEDGTRQQIGD